MNKKILTTLLLSSALLLPTASPQTVQAATTETNYEWSYQGEGYNASFKDKTIVRNGVNYIEFTSVAWLANLNYTLDFKGKRAGFNAWIKKIAVRDGSKIAMLDGKKVTMEGAAFLKNNPQSEKMEVYVPLKFAVQALDGKYNKYDSATHMIKISNIHNYSFISKVYKGVTYTVTKANGDIFSTVGNNKPIKLTSLNASLDLSDINIRSTPKGLLLITVNDSYGEPHINSQLFQVLLKKGQVIRRTSVDFNWGSTDRVDSYNNKIVLNDGQKLRIIEDGTGNVLETINLLDLAGKGKNQLYSIEAIDDAMILIRNTGDRQLQLISRKTGKSVILFDQLLTPKQQELVKLDSGAMGAGDGLTFIKQKGDTLYFTISAEGLAKTTATYSLSKLAAL
ncbi:stalk domain-containing protein [Paenibacillus dauci]|uniref:stalk domain-containing protein n=1 Tax=Paenibacillus dauci TaxID=1567106 RepID=UPI000619FE32|nr:hypothetical protein [Paenibacillus dauci]